MSPKQTPALTGYAAANGVSGGAKTSVAGGSAGLAVRNIATMVEVARSFVMLAAAGKWITGQRSHPESVRALGQIAGGASLLGK